MFVVFQLKLVCSYESTPSFLIRTFGLVLLSLRLSLLSPLLFVSDYIRLLLFSLSLYRLNIQIISYSNTEATLYKQDIKVYSDDTYTWKRTTTERFIVLQICECASICM